MGEIVAVLGASDHKERYSCRAIKLLKANGHTVLPVNPLYDEVSGLPCSKSIKDIHEKIDTITVYVNPKMGNSYSEEIISANPKRVILNPGSESLQLEQRLTEAGIKVIHACTLVMLDTKKF